jgi:hypothetical protein
MVVDVDGSMYEHGAAASVTVYVMPAMSKVPVSGVALVFGAAVNCTKELPAVPLDVMVSQLACGLELAFQVQALGAITPTVPLPPPAGTLPVSEARLYCPLQLVPACEILPMVPPTVIDPFRATAEAALEIAVTFTVPLPVPDDGETVAHDTPLDAAHEQFAPGAVTLRLTEPPTAAKTCVNGDVSTVTLQASAS